MFNLNIKAQYIGLGLEVGEAEIYSWFLFLISIQLKLIRHLM